MARMAHITSFQGSIALVTAGGLSWRIDLQGRGPMTLRDLGKRVGAQLDVEVAKLLAHDGPAAEADAPAPLPLPADSSPPPSAVATADQKRPSNSRGR